MTNNKLGWSCHCPKFILIISKWQEKGNKVDAKKEKKKMGRPTDNPRRKQITLRLSEDELETLNYCSEKLNVNRVEVVVKGIKKIFNDLKNN